MGLQVPRTQLQGGSRSSSCGPDVSCVPGGTRKGAHQRSLCRTLDGKQWRQWPGQVLPIRTNAAEAKTKYMEVEGWRRGSAGALWRRVGHRRLGRGCVGGFPATKTTGLLKCTDGSVMLNGITSTVYGELEKEDTSAWKTSNQAMCTKSTTWRSTDFLRHVASEKEEEPLGSHKFVNTASCSQWETSYGG